MLYAQMVFPTRHYLDLWTTSDPGSDFSIPGTTADFTTDTVARESATASGSIDISGITAGSLYCIYGGYRSRQTFNATMQDTDGSEIDMTISGFGNEDSSNGDEYYVKRIDFTNADDYDTIAWDGTSDDYSGSPHFSFNGVVLTNTAIPEPSSALLFGIASFGMLFRRRR